jgi:hypothetical protein
MQITMKIEVQRTTEQSFPEFGKKVLLFKKHIESMQTTGSLPAHIIKWSVSGGKDKGMVSG